MTKCRTNSVNKRLSAEVDPQLLRTFFCVSAPVEAVEPLVPHDQLSTVVASEADLVGEHLDLSMTVGAYDWLWERL